MTSAFQNFVNQELPRRISTDVPVSGNLPQGKFLQTTGIGLNVETVDTIPGSSISDVEQSLHGFSVLTPIYFDGSRWQKGKANKTFTLASHVVVKVKDANNFQMAMVGRYNIPNHGLMPGEYYFVSDILEGTLTSTEPDMYSNPILFVETGSIIHILPYRPSVTLPTVETTTVSEIFKQVIIVDYALIQLRTVQLENNHVVDTETVTLNGLLLEKDVDYIIQRNSTNIQIEEIVFDLELDLVETDRIVFKATFKENE